VARPEPLSVCWHERQEQKAQQANTCVSKEMPWEDKPLPTWEHRGAAVEQGMETSLLVELPAS